MTPADKHSREWREEIVASYRDGLPTKEIAAKFGISATYPCQLARLAGERLRLAGASWKRREWKR